MNSRLFTDSRYEYFKDQKISVVHLVCGLDPAEVAGHNYSKLFLQVSVRAVSIAD